MNVTNNHDKQIQTQANEVRPNEVRPNEPKCFRYRFTSASRLSHRKNIYKFEIEGDCLFSFLFYNQPITHIMHLKMKLW